MKTKFPVHRSPSVTYVRFVMAAMILLAFWLAHKTGLIWLYGVGAVCVVLAVYVYALFGASVTVGEAGIRFHTAGKRIELSWTDIRFAGTAELTPAGYAAPVRILIFARSPIDLCAIERSKTLPTASDEMIFITDQPHLTEALKAFAPTRLHNELL